MKKIVFLVFILIFSLSGLLWLQIVYASPYTSIDVNDAFNMITGGSYPDLVILDVRTQSEYDSVHIEGAVLIPHTELESRIDELDGHNNHEIIVYCGSGVRSVTASEILDAHGFAKVYNMLGGITAWMEADYPVISQYTSIDVNDAYDMITGGSYPDLVILDVRTPSSYAAEHIEDAINIPYYDDADFGSRIFPALDGHEHHEIIVYCSGTNCSKGPNACHYLANQGFTKVYEMSGGIYSWKLAGYPVTSPDTTPPTITITSPQNTTYDVADISLTFTINELTQWMAYSLDGQTNVTVSSNTTLVGLPEGIHTITVYAADTAGNTGHSDTIYFTIDTVLPNIKIISPENKTYATNSVSLSFSVNEPTSWIGYSLDGQANVTIFGDITLSGLSDGSHSLIVYLTIDTTLSRITILSPENKTYAENDIPLSFTVDESVSWMAYSLDGQANVTITGDTTLASLVDGMHYVVVYANDTAGNMGASNTVYFTVDTEAPIIIILSPKNETYASTSFSLNFTQSEPTSWIGYSLDGQTNVTVGGNTTLVGLSEGIHSITVYATDIAGNMGSPDTVYFTVDTVSVSIDLLSPENKTYTTDSVSLSFAVDEETSWIGYSLDGQANNTIAGDTTLIGLSDGMHSLVVYASDMLGNTGHSDTVYFTIDTVLPNIELLSPENKTYAAADVPLSFILSEATSWIGYSLDGQMNVTVSGNITLFGLSDGVHTITVYAADTAGNMGRSVTVYFTINALPPNIELFSPENKTYTTNSVSLSFSVNEPTSWIGYSLDGQANVTIFGDITLSGLSDGSHSLIVYQNLHNYGLQL